MNRRGFFQALFATTALAVASSTRLGKTAIDLVQDDGDVYPALKDVHDDCMDPSRYLQSKNAWYLRQDLEPGIQRFWRERYANTAGDWNAIYGTGSVSNG